MSTTDAERDERLRGIQERVERVTLGPWFHEPRGGQNQNGDYSGMCIYDGHGEYLVHDVSDTDGAFIASAPSDVAWLLAEVARQAAVIQSAREVRDLHEPVTHKSGVTICDGCWGSDGGALAAVAYPCPTVRALDGGCATHDRL